MAAMSFPPRRSRRFRPWPWEEFAPEYFWDDWNWDYYDENELPGEPLEEGEDPQWLDEGTKNVYHPREKYTDETL